MPVSRSARLRSPPRRAAESIALDTVRSPEEQDFRGRIARLKAVVDRALFERKGVLMIPCFAIDRTQAVLFDLHYLFRAEPSRYSDVPVYLNAPMAAQVNGVYADVTDPA